MAKVSAITNRYSIKLAKEEEKQKNYLIDEDFKLEFPMDVLKKKKVEETTIGKNNISIPSLNIPNINEHKVVIEQE